MHEGAKTFDAADQIQVFEQRIGPEPADCLVGGPSNEDARAIAVGIAALAILLIGLSAPFQTSRRRRITPLEARRLALEILHRAEAGRAAAAEAEAKQGINWEEMA